jgi:chaperone BCS1
MMLMMRDSQRHAASLEAMSVVPQRSIVLLEDIDAAFARRDGTGDYRRGASVTLSGLLNTLDGVASSEERIVFMTTNYLNRLDPALIRPGRIDVVREIGHTSPWQLEELFRNFYFIEKQPREPSESHTHSHAARVGVAGVDEAGVAYLTTLPRQFRLELEKRGLQPSPAHIQGFLLAYKRSPEAAIANIEELVARVRESDAQATRPSTDSDTRGDTGPRRSGRRVLTAAEVDKMPFNPQEGWEEACGLR